MQPPSSVARRFGRAVHALRLKRKMTQQDLADACGLDIGYGIAKSHWHKGLASEAAVATLKYGFEQLDLARIVAVTWPDNSTSQRVLEKLGMKYVKQARFYNADVVYYAISRDEYQGKPVV